MLLACAMLILSTRSLSSCSMVALAVSGYGRRGGVQKLIEIVAEVSEVPARNFFLTCDGKILKEHDNLRRVSINCRVLMHGRLEGGVRTIIPGEWSCKVCGAQGCWPTRRSCYKCGSMKTASPVQLGSFIYGYKGILESRVVWGALPLPLPPPQHQSRWWYHPDLLQLKKKGG